MTRLLKAALLFLLAQATAIPLMVVAASADGIPFRGSRIATIEESAFKWTGVYLGGGLGGSLLDGQLSGSHFNGDGVETASGSINGLSGRGFTGDVRLGFDVNPLGTPFLFGVFGGYQFGSIEHESNINFDNVFSASAQISIEPTYYVGARAGLIFHQKILAYVGYAYSQAEMDLSFGGDVSTSCSGPAFRCNQDVDAHSVLAGVEYALAAGLTMGMEYKYTMYDSAAFFDNRDPGGGTVVNFEPDVHSVKLRLNWRPGSLF